jgi:L-ascorbate metabolism protein UlaG (beta-lactamase superfamily)
MQVEWYGQSAFRLTEGKTTLFVDPFGEMSAAAATRGMQFDYPAIAGVEAELLLVTHEHGDHNCVEAIGGEPAILRSTAGRLASPIGDVLAVASEHDEHAGTERGPNTIFVFDFGGMRCAHFGDFGQRALRDEQAEAIGPVELLFIPVGGGPTIGSEQAAAISERLEARLIVPMHYRTPRVNFLEPVDPFLERMAHVQRLEEPRFDTAELQEDRPLAVVPATP